MVPYLAKAFALLSIKRWCVTLGFGCLAWPSLFRSPPIEHLTLDVCRPPLLHFLLHLPSGLYTFTYIYTYPLVFIYSCLASAWQGPKKYSDARGEGFDCPALACEIPFEWEAWQREVSLQRSHIVS